MEEQTRGILVEGEEAQASVCVGGLQTLLPAEA